MTSQLSRTTVRTILAIAVAISTAGTVLVGLRSASADPVDDQPNIVLIVADDMSENLYKYMCELQALEADGVTFKNYFNATPWCCPSRASMQTGKYPHNTHVLTNGDPKGGFGQFLVNDMSTAVGVQIGRAAGYRTGLMGKYLNEYRPDGRPEPRAAVSILRTSCRPAGHSWFSGGGYQGFHYSVVESVDGEPATTG